MNGNTYLTIFGRTIFGWHATIAFIVIMYTMFAALALLGAAAYVLL